MNDLTTYTNIPNKLRIYIITIITFVQMFLSNILQHNKTVKYSYFFTLFWPEAVFLFLEKTAAGISMVFRYSGGIGTTESPFVYRHALVGNAKCLLCDTSRRNARTLDQSLAAFHSRAVTRQRLFCLESGTREQSRGKKNWN